MPVYNAKEYLAEAIESIISQTLIDFELIILDDGSSDDSSSIVRRYSGLDSRIKSYCRENLGLVATRNELLHVAQCEIIAWMDADDISKPERLRIQYDLICANEGLVCVGSFAQCIDPYGNYLCLEEYPLLHDEIVKRQMLGGAMRFPTTIMRRSAALKVGGFRSPFRMGEDLDLLMRLSEIGEMANCDLPLYLYRQHMNSTVSTLGANWGQCLFVITSLARERQDTGSDRLQRGETISLDWTEGRPSFKNTAIVYFNWAVCANLNRNFILAVRYAIWSLLYNPFVIVSWYVLGLSTLGLQSKRVGRRW